MLVRAGFTQQCSSMADPPRPRRSRLTSLEEQATQLALAELRELYKEIREMKRSAKGVRLRAHLEDVLKMIAKRARAVKRRAR
jgi:hypothetical protein